MQRPSDSSSVLDAVVDGVAAEGIAVVAGFLPEATIAALRAEALRRDGSGLLTAAATGHGAARTVHADVRGDRIGWLDQVDAAPVELELLARLDALRIALNRELTLGVWRYEGHYALYPPGARYARHVDRFRDDDSRVLSLVLYLNAGWHSTHGGALRIARAGAASRDVLPQGGTLVAFLAADFEHEVLPASRTRVAVTGWFRTRDPQLQ